MHHSGRSLILFLVLAVLLLPFVAEAMDLGSVVDDACRRAAVLADQRGIEFTWATVPRATVNGDRAWITAHSELMLPLLRRVLCDSRWTFVI